MVGKRIPEGETIRKFGHFMDPSHIEVGQSSAVSETRVLTLESHEPVIALGTHEPVGRDVPRRCRDPTRETKLLPPKGDKWQCTVKNN
ncbi:hypothetical protein H6P81_009675 [Aristolochia fimbriata]|uniref:Uncharacterized protein n=1 Tax=Aristolochia fimbriata TaxID=158543 RepID=A0AAV7ENM0_ARIFI|nr:hypothetical protein H6P81_009675 [Aristolochia fimbriata]